MEVKEAPARGVRAVMGRLFGGKGKARAKAEKVTASAPDVTHVKVIETEATETETAPKTAASEAVATETVVSEAPADPVVAPAATAGPETTSPDAEAPAAEEATIPDSTEAADVVLPLANYDTLTVASLRARLRTLTVDDLVVLINYEKAHEGREDVVGMFERRKAKIIAGETSSFQAVK
jgi:hypothetical protein